MAATHRTFCRICEAHCGLEVDVDGDRIVKIRPDREHPVSQGYVCVKGLQLGALHHDPDRLDYPLKRVGDSWERIEWTQALQEIGHKVKAIRAEFGDRTVGLYTGNPTFFSMQNILFSGAFMDAIGSPSVFASHSIDVNNKFHVSAQMYGLSLVHGIPDLENTGFLVCMGSNPVVSQMSVVQVTHIGRKLADIEQRGGSVIVVDPRRTETAHKVGSHWPIRPGTDAALLLGVAAALRERADELPLQRAREVAEGVDSFLDAVADWSPKRAAEVCGLPESHVRRFAEGMLHPSGAAIYMSTGVNMSGFGSLAYWLAQSIMLLTGNLDRRGGLVFPEGAFPALTLSKWLGLGAPDSQRSLTGWHKVAGAFPVAALAGEIQTADPQRLRALFISAGNPAHSVPGDQIDAALAELDLVVGIDLYRNESHRHAHYLLPATDMLERSDFPVSWTLLQVRPHAQFTEAVVPPAHQRRPEWEIFSDLAVACGAPVLGPSLCNALPRVNRWFRRLGRRGVTPDTLLALLLRWGRKVTLAQLRRTPQGVGLPPTEGGTFVGKRVPRGLVDAAPTALVGEIGRFERRIATLLAPGLRLIGLRERRTHNSWMHNTPHLRDGDGPQLLIHPEDAQSRGLAAGDRARIHGAAGTVELPVRITEDVRPGVVAAPHGWGHAGSWTRANATTGGNINTIMPVQIEAVSGQAVMQGHRVEVVKAP